VLMGGIIPILLFFEEYEVIKAPLGGAVFTPFAKVVSE